MNNQKGFTPILIIIILTLVGIGGVFLLGKIQAPAQPQQSSPTMSSSDTSEWKTYTSEKYNFSMKYPNDWQTYGYEYNPQDEPTDQSPMRYFASSTKGEKILLEVIPESTKSLRDIRLSLRDTKSKGLFEGWRKGGLDYGLTVDGWNAHQTYNPNGTPKVAVAFGHGNYNYIFKTDDDVEDLLGTMLKTFKFGGQRTGFKTYTNTVLNFTMQIPARWEESSDRTYVRFSSPKDYTDLKPFTIRVTSKDPKELFSDQEDFTHDYQENFTIAGLPAYRVLHTSKSGMNAPYENIVFKRGSDIYIIEGSEFHDNEEATLNKVLSSFKFINE